MRSVPLFLCALLVFAGPVFGQDLILPHIPPDPGRVGDCFGNCGAGCDDSPNPCGGHQGWTHDFVIEPTRLPWESLEPHCNGEGNSWWDVYDTYSYMGRWTFHGRVSYGCALHDWHCRSGSGIPVLGFLECVLKSALVPVESWCSGNYDREWSYTYWGTAWRYSGWREMVPGCDS